ncbi:hypothetical protein Mapa_001105 [Marchantia paleacea]|nr:hypothetical protein Mapa_001105 [Marchantia paleacea]
MGDLEAGFAKLQGEDFEYYMQTYSIILGRNSKKTSVDVDLAGLGGGMNISRQHARIFYDFERRRFVLEVLGKNGCYVEGVLYLPGTPPIKLDSQDLLQIGDKKFYFLLPAKKLASRTATSASPASGASRKRPANSAKPSASLKSGLEDSSHLMQSSKKSRASGKPDAGGGRDKKSSSVWMGHDQDGITAAGSSSAQVISSHSEHKGDMRRRGEESGFSQAKAEERDVVSAITTVLQELCAPGEWMPMARLNNELSDHYSHLVSQSKLRRVVQAQEISSVDGETRVKPWAGLLVLLRKYPQHFVINTKVKGRITAEYVALVSDGM